MNLTQILSHIGLGDGNGNTSSMRVIVFVLALAVIVPAVVQAFQTHHHIVWTAQDLEILGIALGAKLVQNTQETKTETPKP